MAKAKEEGLIVEIHWQDGDSSSSKSVEEIFPKAKVMICGGHAGRSHLKQLQALAKKKTFTKAFQEKHKEIFPDVLTARCTCENRKHRQGCGCMTDSFCQRARNNFSNILSESQSPEEFSERLQALVKDEHEWDGGKCFFHELSVRSCGKCSNNDSYKCEGKKYKTREVLKCPFHLLAYKIECYTRSKMADKLVDRVLKRGHSNWLEASHNVFIRFRPKHIYLERLHYHVSTNLGLLQANMTNEFNQQGPGYHWKIELFRRLNLPSFAGVKEMLEKLNRKRKKVLDSIKTTKAKKRRIQLRSQRTYEAQQRKLWSKKHGHHTYGEEEDTVEKVEIVEIVEGAKKKRKCNCGSSSHSLPTHRNCPNNPKNRATPIGNDNLADDRAITSADDDVDFTDDDQVEEYLTLLVSDDELDTDVFEDAITSSCTCGALNKAHSRTCPMNSRVCYVTERQHSKPLYEVEDYVYFHSKQLKNKHIPCQVVECLVKPVANLYRLCCASGIISELHHEKDLNKSSASHSICVQEWRTRPRVSTRTATRTNPCNLQECTCKRLAIERNVIDLADCKASQSKQKPNPVWVKKTLYTLRESDRQLVTSEWLDDNIIRASQLILAQQFPDIGGLEPPTLEQNKAFQSHAGDFVQVLNVRNSHWVLVSNLGCERNVVFVYVTAVSVLTKNSTSVKGNCIERKRY